ncbi:MAG: hypothetical protein ACW99J_19190 [Candidatus Thorarchaeota archaeon]|jgi:hypothetical protein
MSAVNVTIAPELDENLAKVWTELEGDIGDAIMDLLRKNLRKEPMLVGCAVKVESPGYKRGKTVTAPTTRKRKPKPTA